ncbi:hypothetical protein TW81_03475 [Vibrio galatheae]|uniref:Uncharacterized protein n=1 Tax=Vibrio galatheae TaxID=579748 RepID=A0A0F4NNZ8_9VIBR|nr:hypothetical protein [Vibrio galatheae]KJY84599.1 hypothetical protein TW81_03475 [Vibrio galatheae]
MTELEQQLSTIGANTLPTVESNSKAWALFCQQHSPLFERALINKPESPVTHHLLGILTKAHIQATSELQSNLTSIQEMYRTFSDYLGSEHADKFTQQGLEQLALSTHLWLYLQGYLKLDFSLANDHALNSAELISAITQQDVQMLRTQFLASYYTATERSPVETNQASKLMIWLKKRFAQS